MFRFLVLAMFVALTSAFMAPVMPSKLQSSKITMQVHAGQSKFGGEATRDPEPTAYDPNDPKGKQQAIHKAESFAEYLAKRSAGGAGGGPGSGDHGDGGRSKFGGEATRDPEPTAYDPNDPKGKQQAIHKAESFAEYLAKRSAGGAGGGPGSGDHG